MACLQTDWPFKVRLRHAHHAVLASSGMESMSAASTCMYPFDQEDMVIDDLESA